MKPKQKEITLDFEKLNTGTQKLLVGNSKGFEVINALDIIRIEAQGSYSKIFLKDDKRLLISKSLIKFNCLFSQTCFFRPHKSHIINLNYIKEIQYKTKKCVEMKDETLIPLSFNSKKELIKRLSDYFDVSLLTN